MTERSDAVAAIEQNLSPWLDAIDQVSANIAAEVGVGKSDLACLFQVLQEGPITATELAGRLRLTTGAITRKVDRLAKADLLRRTTDAKDRRRVLIEVVPKKMQRVEELHKPLVQVTNRSLHGFTTREVQVVARFMESMVEGTQALLPKH